MSAELWQEVLMPTRDECLWELFHENSKLSRLSNPLPETSIVEIMKAQQESLPYHGYPEVPLPDKPTDLHMSVDSAIRTRVSTRQFQAIDMPFDHLATILHYGYGISRTNEGSDIPKAFRLVPSAGALYPLELYFYAGHIAGTTPGLYHYNPMRNSVRLLRAGSGNDRLFNPFVQGTLVKDASVIIFLTAIFEKCTFKYGERGYRFIFLEAGHVAQNINLVAAALGLSSLNIGGFYDREIDEYLEIDGVNHSTIYIVSIG